MIKKILVSLVIVFAVSTAYSQRAFDKGDIGINLGVSLGSVANTYATAVNASVEFGLFPVGKAGVISLGGYSDLYYTSAGIRPVISARGTFHLGFLKTEKFDVYGGVGTGFGIYEGGTLYFEEFVGGRIKLKSKLGVFAELGWGGSNLKAGVCWIL